MIRAENLYLRAGSFELPDVNFQIESGQYAILMGKTGSGKTTLLEAICGLKPVADGKLFFGKRDVTNLPPGARGIGYVPQDGALFQTMTVFQHLEFALELRKWTKPQRNDRVRELAEMLGISHLLHRKPLGLSGGEAQRVSLGRALSSRPEILCLDEPLSALDEETHEGMCELLDHIRRETGVTIFHVTHSRKEAQRLGEVVFRITNGSLIPWQHKDRETSGHEWRKAI